MNTDFDLIFDNGGGITLQTKNYMHLYDDPKQAVQDVQILLLGGSTKDWDGNQFDDFGGKMFYDYNTEQMGGYKWLTGNEVNSIIEQGLYTRPFGYNDAHFFELFDLIVE